MPRMLCVIDEFQVLLAGNDPIATEAVGLLESLARKGRSYGIHLILASQTVLGVEALYAKRDSIFGQFPVRIALPGGGDVLEPTNDAAAGLPLGTAVVNTAGGLGGPRGATRGHERTVRFPDPHADKDVLSDLRHRLWGARDPESVPPRIFAGYAHQHLADDPTYRAALAGRAGRPAALVGRVIDVGLSTAAFPLDASPGRHLAIFGSQASGSEVLDAAARSVAAFHSPRTARFVIASLVAEGDQLGRGAGRGDRATGRRWSWSTRPGWPPRWTWTRPATAWCSAWTRPARAACRACAGCCARVRAGASICCPGGAACAGSARRPAAARAGRTWRACSSSTCRSPM